MPSFLEPVLRAHPELEGAAALLHALVAAMRELPVELPEGVPHAEAARARLAEGIPALAGEPLLPAPTFVHAMQTIAAAVEQTADGKAAAGPVRRMLERHGAALGAGDEGAALADAALAGDHASIAAFAARLGVDDVALVTIADHAARPALRQGAARVAAIVAEREWSRGTCPACGAPPLLAELHGGEGERVLRCGRCATAWSFPRVACPACGTRDHRSLGYLYVEGEAEHRRVDRCDSCHSYVKAVAVLGPLGLDELAEADLATVTLDLVAVKRGYTRAGSEGRRA